MGIDNEGNFYCFPCEFDSDPECPNELNCRIYEIVFLSFSIIGFLVCIVKFVSYLLYFKKNQPVGNEAELLYDKIYIIAIIFIIYVLQIPKSSLLLSYSSQNAPGVAYIIWFALDYMQSSISILIYLSIFYIWLKMSQIHLTLSYRVKLIYLKNLILFCVIIWSILPLFVSVAFAIDKKIALIIEYVFYVIGIFVLLNAWIGIYVNGFRIIKLLKKSFSTSKSIIKKITIVCGLTLVIMTIAYTPGIIVVFSSLPNSTEIIFITTLIYYCYSYAIIFIFGNFPKKKDPNEL